MPVDYGLTIAKIAGTVITRAAPSGLKLVKSWWYGKKVILIGQSRAGKTTFLDYFQYGLFEDEKERERTHDVLPSARFDVKVGKAETLEINVAKAVDVGGHHSPFQQARLIVENNPQALLIFLDSTVSLTDSKAWLTEFCQQLENQWRIKGSRKNKVKSIILVLNKKDKVEATEIESKKKAFKKIIDSELREARGKILDGIPVFPTVMVNNQEGTKSADSLIAHLAKALIR